MRFEIRPPDKKARISWTLPAFTNIPCRTYNIRQLQGPAINSEVEAGKYDVTYGLFEENQLKSVSSFIAEVVGAATALRVKCLPDTEIIVRDSGGITIQHPLPAVISSEGKSNIVQVSGIPSGSMFLPGEHIVSFRITDRSQTELYCNRVIRIKCIPEKKTPSPPPVLPPSLPPSPPPPPLPPPIVKERPADKAALLSMLKSSGIEDSIHIQSETVLKSRIFTLVSFDNMVADNDRISIYLNDSLIVDNKELKKIPDNQKLGKNLIDKVIEFPPGPNMLVIKALNSGSKGMNTATIRLYEGVVDKNNKIGFKVAHSAHVNVKKGVAAAIDVYIE
jgi:hypothetical protein